MGVMAVMVRTGGVTVSYPARHHECSKQQWQNGRNGRNGLNRWSDGWYQAVKRMPDPALHIFMGLMNDNIDALRKLCKEMDKVDIEKVEEQKRDKVKVIEQIEIKIKDERRRLENIKDNTRDIENMKERYKLVSENDSYNKVSLNVLIDYRKTKLRKKYAQKD